MDSPPYFASSIRCASGSVIQTGAIPLSLYPPGPTWPKDLRLSRPLGNSCLMGRAATTTILGQETSAANALHTSPAVAGEFNREMNLQGNQSYQPAFLQNRRLRATRSDSEIKGLGIVRGRLFTADGPDAGRLGKGTPGQRPVSLIALRRPRRQMGRWRGPGPSRWLARSA